MQKFNCIVQSHSTCEIVLTDNSSKLICSDNRDNREGIIREQKGKIWIFSVCAQTHPPPPPQLIWRILFAPPDARAIFLHDDLLCNGTCSVTEGGGITYWGGTDGKDPKILRNNCSMLSKYES